jgi:monoamine oxidase
MPSEVIVKTALVTAIEPDDVNDMMSPLRVTAGGKQYLFSHVISVVPLPSFATIDTSKLSISPMQRNAIRRLQYEPSTKVGMRFQSNWWKEDKQIGGQSFTDLPIRTVVYPSYGDSHESNILLASYCWTSDAERLSSLMCAKCMEATPRTGMGVVTESTDTTAVLDDFVLRDLAAIHEVDIEFLRQ